MDKLEAMGLFVRVVEAGSFASVARQMNVARSVVTRQVAGLETQLGTKLLARSTRRLSLTSAGTLYLEKCRVILNLVEAADTDVAEERGVPRGPIHIGMPLIYGLRRLVPLLLDFARRYPEVRLSMDFNDRRVNLVEEAIDLSIRITERLEPTDVARRIGACRLVLVASPDYLARHGIPKRPADLGHHQCLGYTLGSGSPGWTFLVDGRPETVFVSPHLNANNGEALAEAAVQGMGIALQPDFIVRPYLADKRLVPLMKNVGTPELGIYALLPGNRLIPHRVRALTDYLAASLAKTSPRPRKG